MRAKLIRMTNTLLFFAFSFYVQKLISEMNIYDVQSDGKKKIVFSGKRLKSAGSLPDNKNKNRNLT